MTQRVTICYSDQNRPILRVPKPLKTSGSKGVIETFSSEGRLMYTQIKAILQEFTNVKFILPYDVTVTSQSFRKVCG